MASPKAADPGEADVPYPSFGRQLRADMERIGLDIQDLADAVGVRYETARLWYWGKSMPGRKQRPSMAKLLGKSISQMLFPDEGPPPGVVLMPLVDVTPDEQMLIDAYRRLPEPAKKALRGRASELLEAFGKPSKGNPFGKGKSSTQ